MRLQKTANHFIENDTLPKERRGDKFESVEHSNCQKSAVSFVKFFSVRDSHYGRNNSVYQYLPFKLNFNRVYTKCGSKSSRTKKRVSPFLKLYFTEDSTLHLVCRQPIFVQLVPNLIS